MSNSNLIVEKYKVNVTSQKITDLDINLDVDYDNLKVNGRETGGESSKKLFTSLVNNYIQPASPQYIGYIFIYDGTDLYEYTGVPSN